MVKELYIKRNDAQPWLLECDFPFHERLKNWIKQFPGSEWLKSSRTWLMPAELLPWLELEAAACDFTVIKLHLEEAKPTLNPFLPATRQYQRKGSERAALAEAFLLNYTMGLGKSASAIEAAFMRSIARLIIISPAIVRSVWSSEEVPVGQLQRWWPADDVAPTFVYRGSRDKKRFAKWVDENRGGSGSVERYRIITSYGLVGEVVSALTSAGVLDSGPIPPHLQLPDGFFLDEIHYLANPKSGYSKDTRALLRLAHRAWRIGLTGTAITNDVPDLWHILDTLWPDRFGTYFNFCKRYAEAQHNGYGWSFKGLNEEYAQELTFRLATISERVTESDLPPGTLPALEVNPLVSELTDPVEAALEWANDMAAAGESYALMTHLRVTAEALAQKLGVPVIHGELSPEERDAVLAESMVLRRPLVATLHSVGIGKDLTFWNRVLFVEPTERPEELIQALKRFHRLNSTSRVLVWLLSLKGSAIIARLSAKFSDINMVIAPGDSEKGLAHVITNILHTPLDPKVFNDMLAKALASFDPNGSIDTKDDADS